MSAQKTAEKIGRCFKTLLLIVVPLMPIWYSPIRTAPVQSHLVAWGFIVIAAVIFCVVWPNNVSKKVNGLILYGIGGVIGGIGSSAIGWDMLVGMNAEGKLVSFYFVGAISFWFMYTHCSEDGVVKWK